MFYIYCTHIKVPEPKPPTVWEQFAQQKGIKKVLQARLSRSNFEQRKRDRMVVDEHTGLLRPTYGANRANNDNEVWVVEDKPNRGKALTF